MSARATFLMSATSSAVAVLQSLTTDLSPGNALLLLLRPTWKGTASSRAVKMPQIRGFSRCEPFMISTQRPKDICEMASSHSSVFHPIL